MITRLRSVLHLYGRAHAVSGVGCQALQRCFDDLRADDEPLALHLWSHRHDPSTFLREPGLDAPNGCAELPIHFGVIFADGPECQTDPASGAAAVGAEIDVADLLAAQAFRLGLAESVPWWRAGGTGRASLTGLAAGAGANRRIARRDGGDRQAGSGTPVPICASRAATIR